jgi:hypothetical protein
MPRSCLGGFCEVKEEGPGRWHASRRNSDGGWSKLTAEGFDSPEEAAAFAREEMYRQPQPDAGEDDEPVIHVHEASQHPSEGRRHHLFLADEEDLRAARQYARAMASYSSYRPGGVFYLGAVHNQVDENSDSFRRDMAAYSRGRRGGRAHGTVLKSMDPPATLPRTAGGQVDEMALRKLYLRFRPEELAHLTKEYVALHCECRGGVCSCTVE